MKRLSFSDDMMLALAAGSKSMTRRPIKQVIPLGEAGVVIKPRFKVGELTAATCAFQVNDSGESRTGADYRFNSPHLNEWPWSTSRIMPSALAPFVLRITEVRAERLGEISELDAEREGAVEWFERATGVSTIKRRILAAECFAELWNHVYGAGAWERDRSSWVWAISFEIVERRI